MMASKEEGCIEGSVSSAISSTTYKIPSSSSTFVMPNV
ncbi:hypothetical protein M6B38_323770 [Iris pallida]|uniref:Uncharacterized protein n=1 Tax=Iris pallida TaxID=29817 RepID=A0AAX6H8K3_IRIPA|nr:hypothetical protein M6B38_323770 [Iris pallida]